MKTRARPSCETIVQAFPSRGGSKGLERVVHAGCNAQTGGEPLNSSRLEEQTKHFRVNACSMDRGGHHPSRPSKAWVRRGGSSGAQADMPLAEASSAICVQTFDDSRNSAIHITYRISLRSSSLREPRYPLLRVVLV